MMGFWETKKWFSSGTYFSNLPTQLHNLLDTAAQCFWCSSKFEVRLQQHYLPPSLRIPRTSIFVFFANFRIIWGHWNIQWSVSFAKLYVPTVSRFDHKVHAVAAKFCFWPFFCLLFRATHPMDECLKFSD